MSDQDLETEKKRLSCFDRRPSIFLHDPTPELRRRINAAGTPLVGFQCTTCGCWHSVRKSLVQSADSLPVFDDSIRAGFYGRISAAERERLDLEHEQFKSDKQARYSAYLKTDKWKAKRAAVFKRDGGICQACLDAPAEQVHHKSYDYIFDEPLFDLVAICVPCHERITAADRARHENRGVSIRADGDSR